MSIFPQEIHAALSQLISVLTSPDNNLRSQAEAQLDNDWVKTRPEVLLMGLAEQIDGAQDVGVCHVMSCFLSHGHALSDSF